MTKVGVAGGGLVGSLLAWRAVRAGASVEIFDAGSSGRCGNTAAGMLSPVAELATAKPSVSELGLASLPLWQDWLKDLGIVDALVRRGSLLVAHGQDATELERLVDVIRHATTVPADAIVALDRDSLAELEPELGHLRNAYHLPGEAHLDSDAVLAALRAALESEAKAQWHDGVAVDSVSPNELRIDNKAYSCDWACDCRGMGAAGQLELRPVRGEIIHLDAPEVSISRPVRLAHRRYPIYVVPRGRSQYLVGATEIESGDTGNLSVRSALELLSAAFSLHPGFGEAQLCEARIGLRPALRDNTPQLVHEPGFVSINGMYRHGFLAGPALVEQATSHMRLAA